ncbi:MAG: hypothetical protein C0412_00075 [Flavobacterium sp.]|nr:hypothetical protein [Flavobacterium sp.]
MKNVFLFIFILTACNIEPPYTKKTDVYGFWNADEITIVTKKNFTKTFDVENYGYANLDISPKGYYESTINILKDIIVEKEIFGNNYKHIMIQKGYKNYKYGKSTINDSTIELFKSNELIWKVDKYYFKERTMITCIEDTKENKWKIVWHKVRGS